MIQSPESTLAQHLDSAARLLWSGKPRSDIRLRPQDVYLIPFSLLWGGFAIFWEFMALTQTSKAPGPVAVVFPLFGLPFVLVGLYLIFGRFFADARSRTRTFYGVTNERIIIVSGLFLQQIKSLQLRTLTDVSLTQRSDGSGTITFGPTHMMNSFFPAGAWPGTGRYASPSFDLIGRAKEVYDIIRNAQKTTPANA